MEALPALPSILLVAFFDKQIFGHFWGLFGVDGSTSPTPPPRSWLDGLGGFGPQISHQVAVKGTLEFALQRLTPFGMHVVQPSQREKTSMEFVAA